jgi:hypothetical protein
MKKLFFLTLSGLAAAVATNAQLTINSGAIFQIQSGAVVTVQGDVLSNADVTGAGNMVLKGTATQNVNMNGFTIPNLEVDNATHANLTGNAKITNNLVFTNGKLILGSNNLTFAQAATASGMGANKFVETNGTGVARRELASNITNAIMPVGLGSDYLPVSLTHTGGTYASANIAVQAKAGASTNKHPRTESYISNSWPITKTGITGGTTNAVGTYVDPTAVTGTEAELRGFFWNGTQWSRTGASNDATANTAGAEIIGNSGELYAMNRFVLLDAKTFLQGAYNSGTSLMNDALRNTAAYGAAGTVPTNNLLPSSDPYRGATYSTAFVHVNNPNIEVASASAFNDKANAGDNIVDWVFVELRNTTTPGNAVIQTRAALIQRDGDIVDMDGVTPLYFKNNAGDANFSVTVRHRNHLSMSTNPTAFTQALDIQANATKLDFATVAAASLMGAANTNYFNNGTVSMLYAGNVNGNTNVRYSGPGNDRVVILGDIGSESGTITGYLRSDVNLNRSARYSGPTNDRVFILSNVLGSVESGTKNQSSIP